MKNWRKFQRDEFQPNKGDFDRDPNLEGKGSEFVNFETSSRFCMKNHKNEAIWGACLLYDFLKKIKFSIFDP